MKRKMIYLFLMLLIAGMTVDKSPAYEKDTIKTSGGPLVITFIKHGSLMFEYNDQTIHFDPVMRMGDYSKMPDADLILITHHHGDHLDLNAIEEVRKPNTRIVATKMCVKNSEELGDVVIMDNGDVKSVTGLEIHAVPAYNIKNKRENGEPYHKKGECNGYRIRFGDKKVYVAGDTENIPEMKKLGNIEVAFLPMNLPYTMSPEMAADAAKMVKPRILYPYHFGRTDPTRLVDLLKDEASIEVRIRDM